MAEDRVVGTVKWFDPDRGYGFIQQQEGDDVFVHISEVRRASISTLAEGQRVTFVIGETPRGLQAENLSLVEGERVSSTSPRRLKGRTKRRPPGPEFRLDTRTDFDFGPEYLANGYFEDEHQAVVYPQVLDDWAIEIAKLLGNKKMPTHQFRRFFNKARSIADRLESGASFETVRAGILSLKRDAARAVGRGVVPEEFKVFIERNVALATKNAASFQKGFMDHFQSVLAYFTYYFRDQ